MDDRLEREIDKSVSCFIARWQEDGLIVFDRRVDHEGRVSDL